MKIIGYLKVVGVLKFRQLMGYENLKREWFEYDTQTWGTIL